MKFTADPNMMYLWQAKPEPDFLKFQEVTQKEFDDHALEISQKSQHSIRSTCSTCSLGHEMKASDINTRNIQVESTH